MESLADYKRRVEELLEAFFSEKIKDAEKVDRNSAEMISLLKAYTLNGGKRVRSALTYYGYLCFKDEDKEEIMKVSMALELLQSFLLIHDDIIDNDDFRRGKPSLHKMYEKLIKKRYPAENHEHIAKSLAIVAGDVCYAFANEIIAKANLEEKRKNEALKYMNHIMHIVCYGQALDILSCLREDMKHEDVKKINVLKTATYTVTGPLVLGAILADADKDKVRKLEMFGDKLGEAFQIQDDIIGLFGDEKEVGKPIGSDIKEGKKTLLMLKTLENADREDKDFIKNRLGKPISKGDLDKVRSIVKNTGSLDYCRDHIKQITSDSLDMMKKMELREEGKYFLLAMCNFLERRSY